MTVYGEKPFRAAYEQVPDRCPGCGTTNTTYINLYQNYFHFLFIPVFPLEKHGGSECTLCHRAIEWFNMPVLWQHRYKDLKKKTRPKLWMFSGIGVALLILAGFIIGDRQEKQENRKYLQSPIVGDLYEVKLEKESYVLYKVNEIIGDTIYVVQSKYLTSDPKGYSKIINKGFDEDSTVGILRSELQEMFEDDKILDVRRRKDAK